MAPGFAASPAKDRAAEVLTVVLFTLAAAAAQLALIGNNSFTGDEQVTLLFLRADWSELWGRLWGADTHRPYYYMLLKAWSEVFGESRFALRSLGGLLHAASLPFVWVLARRLGGRRAAVWALAFSVLSPLAIFYGRDIRNYPLVTFSIFGSLAALSALAAAERAGAVALSTRRRVLLWAGVTVGAASAFYAHSISVLYPMLVGLWALGSAMAGLVSWRFVGQLVLAGLALALISVPAVLPMLHHAETTLKDFWIPPTDPGRLVSQMRDAYPYPAPLLPVVLGLLGFGLWRLRGSGAAGLLIPAMVIGQPVALALLGLVEPVFITRAMVWPAMLSSVLLGLGLAGLPGQQLRLGVAALVLLAQALAARVDYVAHYQPSEPERLAAFFDRIDPAETDLILGRQNVEHTLRWDYPALFDGPVFAFNKGDEKIIYDAANRSVRVLRAEADALPLTRPYFLIVRQIRPPAPPGDEVTPALARIAARGRLVAQAEGRWWTAELYERTDPP
ncbi:glycosyltransferase family 39 protein [Rhodovulum kholense]|uniref:Dolichyl-phosphate-mannose-protein mannosyltransferase n=1 Tax=Rhodovulum kholense TaxID=453584 RepID=A0A8E2VGK9_9RHOB|nr:glycosyltransferase family 39 protein [Rhodovulum kholense]PTW44005.1 dolichyl-phosphate-mannose-protein mannosyltransferase [Rhodovulum kholense]